MYIFIRQNNCNLNKHVWKSNNNRKMLHWLPVSITLEYLRDPVSLFAKQNPKKTEERAKVNYSVITTLWKWWEFLRHPLPVNQHGRYMSVKDDPNGPGHHDPRRLSALCSRVPPCLRRESCSCTCVLAVWIVTLSFGEVAYFRSIG